VKCSRRWLGAKAKPTRRTYCGRGVPLASISSKDAALFETGATALGAGKYTIQVNDAIGGSGTVIAAIYDANGTTYTVTTPRLINVSVLKQISAGTSLTAGFVIGGTAARGVLIRAIGPGLTPLGIGGVMSDPQLKLNNVGVSPTVLVATNENWAGEAAIVQAAATVGAFPVGDGASKDAAGRSAG